MLGVAGVQGAQPASHTTGPFGTLAKHCLSCHLRHAPMQAYLAFSAAVLGHPAPAACLEARLAPATHVACVRLGRGGHRYGLSNQDMPQRSQQHAVFSKVPPGGYPRGMWTGTAGFDSIYLGA